jgi:hypothetical protein
MASPDEEAWYLEGSGVPVGWKEGAVGLRGELVTWPLAAASSCTAIGDIVRFVGVERNVLKKCILMKESRRGYSGF